jgi:hypothetical protein
MPGNVWLIPVGRDGLAAVVTACGFAAAKFEQSAASTYMIAYLGSTEIPPRRRRLGRNWENGPQIVDLFAHDPEKSRFRRSVSRLGQKDHAPT